MMIGKILAHLLGNPDDDDVDAADDLCDDLVEFEEGGWVIVHMQEELPVDLAEEDPLENLLIEHPSMSVYQERQDQEDQQQSDQGHSPRLVPVRHHISWRLAAWGSPRPCHLHLLALTDRKRLTKSALHRHNLARTRFCPAQQRYGHFKQPCQRLYNY